MSAFIRWNILADVPSPGPTAGTKGFRDLKLGDDGDLVLQNGTFATVAGIDAIAQGVKVALQLFRGEWFDDPDAGVPWLTPDGQQQIFGSRGASEVLVRDALTTAIKSVKGVKDVTAMTVSLAGRQLQVTFTATTELGTISGGTA